MKFFVIAIILIQTATVLSGRSIQYNWVQNYNVIRYKGGQSNDEDKVLLEKVTAITLTEGKMSNGRHSPAVRQVSTSHY